MNIFVLDLNPKICAQYHCNKHVVKMIIESAQMLASSLYINFGINSKKRKDLMELCKESVFYDFPRLKNGKVHPYGIGYLHHGCTKWVSESRQNYLWLLELLKNLCSEYTKRYGKIHSIEKMIKFFESKQFLIPDVENTQFYLAMDEEFKSDDIIESYRNFYKSKEKRMKLDYFSEIPLFLK